MFTHTSATSEPKERRTLTFTLRKRPSNSGHSGFRPPRYLGQGPSGVAPFISQLSPPRQGDASGVSCDLEPLWRVVDYVCHLQTPPLTAELFKARCSRDTLGESLAGRWRWSAGVSPSARSLLISSKDAPTSTSNQPGKLVANNSSIIPKKQHFSDPL